MNKRRVIVPDNKERMLLQKDHNVPAPGDFSVVKLLVKKVDAQPALKFITSVKNKESSSEEEYGN